MIKFTTRRVHFWLLCTFICYWACCFAVHGEQSGVNPEQRNPHTGKKCTICHFETEKKLNSRLISKSLKMKLRGGANAVCLKCHSVEKGHGVGKKPALNNEQL